MRIPFPIAPLVLMLAAGVASGCGDDDRGDGPGDAMESRPVDWNDCGLQKGGVAPGCGLVADCPDHRYELTCDEASGACTCSQDGAPDSDVDYEDAFCTDVTWCKETGPNAWTCGSTVFNETFVSLFVAAASACGW